MGNQSKGITYEHKLNLIRVGEKELVKCLKLVNCSPEYIANVKRRLSENRHIRTKDGAPIMFTAPPRPNVYVGKLPAAPPRPKPDTRSGFLQKMRSLAAHFLKRGSPV